MHHITPSAPAHEPLVARVEALVRSTSGLQDIHIAATAFRDDPALLRNVLVALSNEDPSLRDVAARSSVHPNGFAKVVLHVGDGWSIRLHVWPSHTRPDSEDAHPHGHRWEFASWIITGVIREITFTESPDGERFDRCDYGRKPHGSAYLRPNGRVTLAPVAEIDRTAGTVYMRSRSELHTAEPRGQGLVASLVLQGRRSVTPTPVYLRPGTPPIHEERALTADDLRSLLVEVAGTIR